MRLQPAYFVFITVITLNQSCTKNNSSTAINTTSVDNNTTDTLPEGLVAWYDFNGNIKDHSSEHNNIKFNTATPTSGKKGKPNTAYYFNGSTSYMSVPNSPSLNPTHAITIEAEIKPTGFYQGLCHSNRILIKGSNDGPNGVYFLGYDDQPYYNFNGCSLPVQDSLENFYCKYGNDFSSAGVYDTDYIEVNNWYNLIFTYDGTTVKYYVNGILKARAKQSATFTPNENKLTIGRMLNDQYPYWFTGVIDDIRIYNRAITTKEAEKLYRDFQ